MNKKAATTTKKKQQPHIHTLLLTTQDLRGQRHPLPSVCYKLRGKRGLVGRAGRNTPQMNKCLRYRPFGAAGYGRGDVNVPLNFPAKDYICNTITSWTAGGACGGPAGGPANPCGQGTPIRPRSARIKQLLPNTRARNCTLSPPKIEQPKKKKKKERKTTRWLPATGVFPLFRRR